MTRFERRLVGVAAGRVGSAQHDSSQESVPDRVVFLISWDYLAAWVTRNPSDSFRRLETDVAGIFPDKIYDLGAMSVDGSCLSH